MQIDSAEVVIIGGGVTGLSSAWWLAKSGVDTIVLDKGVIGYEASSRNGGGVATRASEPPVAALGRSRSGCGPRCTRIWATPRSSGPARSASPWTRRSLRSCVRLCSRARGWRTTPRS